LLVPAAVDAETGYRWYADTQLEQARVVASLRRIRVPLARIRDMLALDSATAAEEIRAYWAGTEGEHAAQRVLDAPGMGGGETQAGIAIEALFAWASEQHRQPAGGVRSVLVFNPAN
jgi:DNA-binding transcriptional MerR regulator